MNFISAEKFSARSYKLTRLCAFYLFSHRRSSYCVTFEPDICSIKWEKKFVRKPPLLDAESFMFKKEIKASFLGEVGKNSSRIPQIYGKTFSSHFSPIFVIARIFFAVGNGISQSPWNQMSTLKDAWENFSSFLLFYFMSMSFLRSLSGKRFSTDTHTHT